MEITTTSTISVMELINLSRDLAQINLGYLGISVTILAILGGVFIYFNIKPLKDALNKQESVINDLKKEAGELLDSSKTQLREGLDGFEKEQSDKLLLLQKQEYDKITLEIKNQISTFENTFSEKIGDVSENKDNKLKELLLSEVDNRLRMLEKSLSIEINTSKDSFNEKADSLRDDIKELKRDLKELKVYRYSQEGKMGAIIYSIELLKEDIDEKSWRIPTTLEKLKNHIKGVALDADYITRIEEQLARIEVDKKYNVLINEIRGQYSRK